MKLFFRYYYSIGSKQQIEIENIIIAIIACIKKKSCAIGASKATGGRKEGS